MKNASKLIAAVLVLGLLTGCKGGGTAATDPSDALLATETTAATTATKPTTKATTKPTTKPTTGKTDTTTATEATKPVESQKPVETQKPTEAPKSNDTPKATEAPKPTNPPATQPPATEAPKPTEPPATEPPETEPALEPYHYDIYEAMDYGNSYAASQGFVIDYSLDASVDGYVMTTTIPESYLDYDNGQSTLNSLVIEKVNGTMDELSAAYGTTDWSVVRGRAYVECTTSNGEPAYRIYFLYG